MHRAVVTELLGQLVPRPYDILEVNPLVPEGAWDYFCLEDVPYHGSLVTVLYDRTGGRYQRGAGLCVLIDGRESARCDGLGRVAAQL